MLPAAPDPSLSPGGDYQATTTVMTSTSGLLSLSTSIVVTPTGQVMNTVPWSIDQRLGEMGLGGAWITDRLFLIYETLPQGPLLIDVGGDVIQIAPDLFGVPTDPGWPAVFYRAQAFMQPGTQTYHLILSAGGEERLFPPVRLYHSEMGQVEEMPFAHLWSPAFSPDGRYLLLDARPDRDGYECNAYIVPLDRGHQERDLCAHASGLCS